jgi:undecaprenyl-diphosphatase
MSRAVGRPTPVPPRRQAAVLALWWLVVTGLVVGAGLLLTSPLTRVVRSEDNAAERWFAAHRSPWVTGAAQGVSRLGDALTTIGLSVVCALVLWWWLRRRRLALFVLAAALGEFATYLIAVNVVQRPRPAVPRFDEGLEPFNSYPSGHVAAAMATYGGLAVLVWALGSGHRRWLTPLLLAPPAVVALARLYLGVHHPTDVTASILFMSGWLNRCAAVLLRADGRPVDPVPAADERPHV